MAKIFVTQSIPEAGIIKLREAGHELVLNENLLSKDELIAAVSGQGYEALVTLLSDVIDGDVLDAAPELKIVANYAVGFNNIDLAAAAERNIFVSNTPDVLTNTVAEFTITMMLAIAKRVVEADKYTRAGEFHGWGSMLLLGNDLKGKTMGIIGAGRIGIEVAKKAALGLGMKVAYHNPNPSEFMQAQLPEATYYGSLAEMLPVCDVVSIHVPLLPTTTHLISAEELKMMKKEAYLINTARGPIIDEAALATALTSGEIAGAALDVFENEPEIVAELLTMNNVILTPHIASASFETRQEMSTMVADNILAVFAGGEPVNRVLGK